VGAAHSADGRVWFYGFHSKGISLARPVSSTVSSARQKPSASNPSPGSIDPWIIWVAFRRSWFWAIPLGAAFALTAAYYLYNSFVPEYRASHVLEANRDYIVFQGVLAAPRDISSIERQLIVSPLVLEPVMADPEVCQAPSLRDPATRAQNLRSRLALASAGSKALLEVSYRDSDPQHATAVCNAIVESYLRQRQTFDNKRASDLESMLRPAVDRWQAEVKGHQDRVRELSLQAHGFDPYNEVSRIESGTTVMTSLFGQLTQLRGDEEVLRARIEAEQVRREQGDEAPPEIDVSPAPDEIERFIAVDPEVMRLRSREADKAGQMRQMEDNDLVRIRRDWYDKLAAEVATINSSLVDAEAAARERALVQLNARTKQQAVADRSREFSNMQQELAGLITKRETLERSFQDEKTRLQQYAGGSVDLYFAQQEYRQAASILEKLTMRIASLRTERQRGATMQTLARATPPTAPVEKLPTKKILVFGGGAFAIPFLLAVLWELVVKRISTPDGIESRKLMPVIGEVARLPVGSFSSGNKRIFEESVDALRANLLLSREFGDIRSIAVTSSMSGEGKSSLASQLAVSIAKATGETVLLVDVDLRSPDQHHLFGLEMGPGAVGVLSGRVSLEAAVDRSLGSLVHVLPAGYLDASPHRILSPSALRDLLDHALNDVGYRYVLFDTAPILSAGETLAVTAEVDVALLCVMRDVSRLDNVERTVRRLESTGASLAGMVFNGVPSRQYAYRYGDYRYGDLQRQSETAVANV